MRERNRKRSRYLFGSMVLCSILLMVGPQSVQDYLRTALRDFLAPAQTLVVDAGNSCQARWQSWLQNAAGTEDQQRLETELAESRAKNQRLTLQTAEDHQQIKLLESQLGFVSLTEPKPLIVPEIITATILGKERHLLDAGDLLLDQGSRSGIAEEQTAIDQVLLDQGTNADVQTGSEVGFGRSIVGRILKTGRRTSTLQLITHPDYRARVRLVRKTSRGWIYGAEGMLQGAGKQTCTLGYIPSTEAVQVGDLVVTDHSEFGGPLVYGRVIEAELPPAAPHWTISIVPTVEISKLKRIQILKPKLARVQSPPQ